MYIQSAVIEVFGCVNSEIPRILWKFSEFEDDILMMLQHVEEVCLYFHKEACGIVTCHTLPSGQKSSLY